IAFEALHITLPVRGAEYWRGRRSVCARRDRRAKIAAERAGGVIIVVRVAGIYVRDIALDLRPADVVPGCCGGPVAVRDLQLHGQAEAGDLGQIGDVCAGVAETEFEAVIAKIVGLGVAPTDIRFLFDYARIAGTAAADEKV